MAIRIYVTWNKFSETLVPATSPAGSSALRSEAPNSNTILHTSNLTSAHSSLNLATNTPPCVVRLKRLGDGITCSESEGENTNRGSL